MSIRNKKKKSLSIEQSQISKLLKWHQHNTCTFDSYSNKVVTAYLLSGVWKGAFLLPPSLHQAPAAPQWLQQLEMGLVLMSGTAKYKHLENFPSFFCLRKTRFSGCRSCSFIPCRSQFHTPLHLLSPSRPRLKQWKNAHFNIWLFGNTTRGASTFEVLILFYL